MKNKELFDETVNILVNAYQKGTLEYTSCEACAVGNIVAARNNIALKHGVSSIWSKSFHSFGEGIDGIRAIQEIPLESLQQIKSTGYTIEEIALIEKAFCYGSVDKAFKCKDDENFSGLMFVVDQLMVIHEANDSQIEEAKSLFVKETA